MWQRLGSPKQYIEPFCGSAAVLLAAPKPASLEVIGDTNGFIANFWRAVVHQAAEVARWADYPVSHVDLGARHSWLMEQRTRLGDALQNPDWPGDAKVAGWWLWGQCAWIGSGWCEFERQDSARQRRREGRAGERTDSDVSSAGMGVQASGKIPHVSDAGRGVQASGQIPHVGNAGRGVQASGQIPHVSSAGMGVQASGKIPHVSDAGRGVQASGQIPHVGNAGRGVQASGQIPHVGNAGTPAFWTSGGETAMRWLGKLAARLERVRVIHGDWQRCLNNHYGGSDTAIFFDPPYDGFEGLYHVSTVAADVAAWCRENAGLRIALCGHRGNYELPGWSVLEWERLRTTYSSDKTKAEEAIWFSPACIEPQRGLFDGVDTDPQEASAE